MLGEPGNFIFKQAVQGLTLCSTKRSNAFPAECESFLNLLFDQGIEVWFYLRWGWQVPSSSRLFSVWHFASPRRSEPILQNVRWVLNILFYQGIEVWFYFRWEGGGSLSSLPCVLQVLAPFSLKIFSFNGSCIDHLFRDIEMIATGSEGGQIFVWRLWVESAFARAQSKGVSLNILQLASHYELKKEDKFDATLLGLHLPGQLGTRWPSIYHHWRHIERVHPAPAGEVEPQPKGGCSLQGGGQLPGPAAVLSQKAGNIGEFIFFRLN